MISLKTSSYYLKEKHALIVYSNMQDFLLDYFIDRKEQNEKHSERRNKQLLELLAASALHITVRSPHESVAWTVLLGEAEPYSIFVTANPAENMIVGQILTKDIRHTDVNIFHSQLSSPKSGVSNSTIQVESSCVEKMLEAFYEQSEQLPLKASLLKKSDEAMILVGMPNVDLGWFKESEPEDVFKELDTYENKLMKECNFNFACKCSPEKLLPFLHAISKEQLLELLGEDSELVVNCPRCGRNFNIARSLVLNETA